MSTDVPTVTPEQARANRERSRTWYGWLADDNVEHVVTRIKRLLTDHRYVWVSYNTTQTTSMPEVRTGQRLNPADHRSGEAVNLDRLGDVMQHDRQRTWDACHVSVADTYGVWGMHSPYATEADARAAERDYRDAGKPFTHGTYVLIEGGNDDDPRNRGNRDRIEVTFHNGYDERMHWVIQPETPIEWEDWRR